MQPGVPESGSDLLPAGGVTAGSPTESHTHTCNMLDIFSEILPLVESSNIINVSSCWFCYIVLRVGATPGLLCHDMLLCGSYSKSSGGIIIVFISKY